MSEFVTSTLILAAEFGAIVSVFFLVYLAIVYIRRKKDTSLVNDFASQFKQSTTTRREGLQQSVKEAFRVNGEQGQDAINEIMHTERTICSNVLKIFDGRDKGLIMNLKDDLDDLSGAYHHLATLGHAQSAVDPLVIDSSACEPGSDENSDDKESELYVLRVENQRLKEDLKKSLENIDYLQAQYTELFEKTKR